MDDQGTAIKPVPMVKPCRLCEAPVEQPEGRNKGLKDFCSPRHRAAYRNQEQQKAILAVEEAFEDLAGMIEQGMAKLHGAQQLLDRFKRKPRKAGKE